MLEARFIDSPGTISAKTPEIWIGFEAQKFPTNFIRVLVEENSLPVMIINVRNYSDHYFFREEVLIWKNNVVIGIGEQVAMVRLDNLASTNIDLGCYFGHFYPYDSVLLVASAEEVYCIESDLIVRWKSSTLGIDGVVVESLEGDVVNGLGEWDPPGGWQPFSLQLATGESILSS